jgi:hypothetical protein
VIETLAGLTLRDGWADFRRGDVSTRVSLACTRSELADAPRPLLVKLSSGLGGGQSLAPRHPTPRQT